MHAFAASIRQACCSRVLRARRPLNSDIATEVTHGFILMEVLVAFFIFFSVILPSYQSLSIAVRGIRQAHATQVALRFAEAKMASVGFEIPLQDGFRQTGTDEGYDWDISIRKYPDDQSIFDQSDIGGYWVSLSVYWHPSTHEAMKTIQLKTLKLNRS
jgi:type II secretory pathway component PulJ